MATLKLGVASTIGYLRVCHDDGSVTNWYVSLPDLERVVRWLAAVSPGYGVSDLGAGSSLSLSTMIGYSVLLEIVAGAIYINDHRVSLDILGSIAQIQGEIDSLVETCIMEVIL